MELKALDKNTNITYSYLRSQAKQMLAGMKFKEIKPGKFYRAEIAAAKRSAAAKTPEESAVAKAQQLANHHLYREATAVKAAMQRHRKYVKGASTRKYNPKQVDQSYIAQIKASANLYDMRANTERVQDMAGVLSWYETQMKDENQYVDVTMMDLNMLKALIAKEADPHNQVPADFKLPSFEDLTSEEMQSVYDQLRHLRYVGGVKSMDGNAERTVKRTALAESVRMNGGKDNKSNPGFPTRFESGRNSLFHFINSLTSLRNITRKLDNEWDGSTGVAYDLIYADVEQAANKLVGLRHDIYEQYEGLGMHRAKLSRKDAKDYTLSNGRVIEVASEQRFMMAVYWGTETSRDAIRDAHDMTSADVDMILADMTDIQIRLVNAVWKINESLWPQMSKASTTLYGVAPPKLDATPFTINGIAMTGGHQRLMYDSSELELKTEQQANGSQSNVMATKAGSLHARVGSGGRPPALDISNIVVSLNEAMHFIAYAETGNRLHGLIDSNEVKTAIEEKWGKGFYKAMIENVDAKTANRHEREASPFIAKAARIGRASAVAMYLSYGIKNTMEGLATVSIAMDEIGVGRFAVNALKLYPKMFNPYNQDIEGIILEKSVYMRDRGQFINREAAETINQLTATGRIDHGWKKLQSAGFTPQIMVDKLFSYPVWLASYEKAMEDPGMSETKAVSIADTAVAESVGSGTDLHLGGVFGSHHSQWIKLFTMMGSWFNMVYNRMYRHSGGGSKVDLGLVKSIVMTGMMTGVLSALVIGRGPDEDDEQGWASFMAFEGIKFFGASIPLLRTAAKTIETGMAPRGTTVDSTVAAIPDIVSNVWGLMDEDKSGAKKTSALLKSVGSILPLPGAGNITRALDFYDANDGLPDTAHEAYRALTMGSKAVN